MRAEITKMDFNMIADYEYNFVSGYIEMQDYLKGL
jgi:hypothetical protein